MKLSRETSPLVQRSCTSKRFRNCDGAVTHMLAFRQWNTQQLEIAAGVLNAKPGLKLSADLDERESMKDPSAPSDAGGVLVRHQDKIVRSFDVDELLSDLGRANLATTIFSRRQAPRSCDRDTRLPHRSRPQTGERPSMPPRPYRRRRAC